jgi:hypothetical protein
MLLNMAMCERLHDMAMCERLHAALIKRPVCKCDQTRLLDKSQRTRNLASRAWPCEHSTNPSKFFQRDTLSAAKGHILFSDTPWIEHDCREGVLQKQHSSSRNTLRRPERTPVFRHCTRTPRSAEIWSFTINALPWRVMPSALQSRASAVCRLLLSRGAGTRAGGKDGSWLAAQSPLHALRRRCGNSHRNLRPHANDLQPDPRPRLPLKANLLRFRAFSSDDGVCRPSPRGRRNGRQGRTSREGHRRALRRSGASLPHAII